MKLSCACGVGGLVALLSIPAVGVAQSPQRQLDAETIRAVVAQVGQLLTERYVFPGAGERYASGLTDLSGRYPEEITPSELAARVTADLQSIRQDLHLRLSTAPEPAAGGAGGRRVVVAPGGSGGAPAVGETRVQARAGGPAGAEPDALPSAATPEQLFSPIDLSVLPEVGRRLYADEARRNHFFRAVEVLPGNIGYLDYDQFGFPNFSTPAADAAFAFLGETEAIILDLRGNRGGVEGMTQYLATHFFGDNPVHLYSRHYGASGTTLEFTTFPGYVQRRFPELPLYVLVDAGTGSAAENFSYALQGLGRATIIGEVTAGAAHSSRAFPIEPGFLLQLPIARAFNPRTGEDWEGTGVLPDVMSSSESALDVAHGLAVDQLISLADPDDRLALEDAKLLMAARSGSAADPADFGQYVGDFGSRRVYLEDGSLKMVRTDVRGVPPVDLVQMGPDYFTLRQAAVARIRFERDEAGVVVRLHVRLPTGVWEEGVRR